jgi:hypothetical protein
VPDRGLKSLSLFIDVVFALMFFRIAEYLPSFQDGRWVQLPHGLLSLLVSQPTNLTRVVFGLLVTAYYWNRKNALLGLVTKANGLLVALSLASLSFVCLFMWALVADPTYVGGPPTLLLQSLSLFVASLLSFFALRYAIHAGLTPLELKAAAESRPTTSVAVISTMHRESAREQIIGFYGERLGTE